MTSIDCCPEPRNDLLSFKTPATRRIFSFESLMANISNSISPGKQVVLILVGLIGSGKSTFAQALEDHYPEFRRCNQDDLGDRRAVEHLARQSLREGSSVCIDRTNFDASQRAHWIRIAREFPGTLVWILVFDTSKEVCASRLRMRTQHPTIKNPEDALSILDRFSSQYRAPSDSEGMDRLYYLQALEQELVYSHSSLGAILCRVRDAPPSVGPAVSQHSTPGSPYSRGGSPREARGRGGRGYNVNHAGPGGAGTAPTRSSVNRWEALSAQPQAQRKDTEQASAPEIISEPSRAKDATVQGSGRV
ncbi:P-loop containing nucleoside triphosphate hydrolase protein [Mycena alexandri]|uniref:P-loop containing nucleoside triphosphate hydrolase protein n=1 Tax=Mycena alexandri TaxID=1745969 RepID=A0AAD6X5G8_9AGAR|nr:P-loop containing nucleoside triphosphate hydrolase protein [Mycena alexandri]